MEYIKNNFSYIKKVFCSVSGALFGLLSVGLSFLNWDEIGISSKCQRILICVGIILISLVVSLVLLYIKRQNVLWEQGEKSIRVRYADLFKIAANGKYEKIVVIPVNTTFDTIVGDGIVSPGSVHGRWINRFYAGENEVKKLDELIQNDLVNRKIVPLCVQSESEKPKGKRMMYPRGTVAVINGNQTHYYLVALSHFDENLNAQCSKEELLSVITAMIDFYDKNGQGLPIYIPLLGSGISRANVTPSESLQVITDLLKLYRDKIHGEANVIVYSKIKNQVSIFNL